MMIMVYLRQIVQLTALRPTADLFCAHLRDGLRSQLQKGNMKTMKVFVKTCYSEGLLLASAEDGSNEKAVDPSTVDESAGALSKDDEQPSYQGGLGLKYKFPGDAKKCAIRFCCCAKSGGE